MQFRRAVSGAVDTCVFRKGTAVLDLRRLYNSSPLTGGEIASPACKRETTRAGKAIVKS